MKILVACEYSQIVTEAFTKKGHEVMSCDLEPADRDYPHYQGDVFDILNENWDMLIAFPPCQYISYAGTAHWNRPGRLENRLKALEFFGKLYNAPIEKICIENPKGCASPTIAKYSQEIQPYYFGDPHLKTTWLWLKNLPLLMHKKENDLFGPASAVDKPEPISIDNTDRKKKRYYVDAATRDPKERARFWPGIAKAMAEQWT